jgi:N6-L-threonylcarbamoyladenine synthase
LCFAKGIAYARRIPLIGVNHLEGHIFSVFLEHPTMPFPHLCLVASGGHTALYMVRDFGVYTLIGQTLDDAAGEAFDKVAKLLNIGYPGGPYIERLAYEQGLSDIRHYPRLKSKDLNFSFSGLKTAVLYDHIKRGYYDIERKKLMHDSPENQREVSSSFLVCMGDIIIDRLARAVAQFPEVAGISFVGGVACNKYLKERVAQLCAERGLYYGSPSPAFCTDNAAMIGFVGAYKAQQGLYDSYDIDIIPSSALKQHPKKRA